eukprot:SAG11_NODE_4416_length_1905_cov_1.266888_5_plen_86_part_01
MYAVGGEPGISPNAGTAFLFFFLFFFLSNYILLNLFVAVILDNFSATMRVRIEHMAGAHLNTNLPLAPMPSSPLPLFYGLPTDWPT